MRIFFKNKEEKNNFKSSQGFGGDHFSNLAHSNNNLKRCIRHYCQEGTVSKAHDI